MRDPRRGHGQVRGEPQEPRRRQDDLQERAQRQVDPDGLIRPDPSRSSAPGPAESGQWERGSRPVPARGGRPAIFRATAVGPLSPGTDGGQPFPARAWKTGGRDVADWQCNWGGLSWGEGERPYQAMW